MPQQVLFIQGAGDGAYDADAKLVESLRQALSKEYEVTYPLMPHEADAPFDEWRQQISHTLSKIHEPVIVIGHSVGASILLKYLSEIPLKKALAGIFLLSAPFWGGEGWHYEGYQKLQLPANIEAKLPAGTPLFLYHCRDDEIVPYEHLTLYAELLPHATIRPLPQGGHQFNSDLSEVAKDITTP